MSKKARIFLITAFIVLVVTSALLIYIWVDSFPPSETAQQTNYPYSDTYVLTPIQNAELYTNIDDAGESLSYDSNTLKPAEKYITDPITEEEAAELALKHLSNQYANYADLPFTLNKCWFHESGKEFHIEYAVKYGVDNFLSGPVYRCTVYKDGSIAFSVLQIKPYLNFDADRLKNLSQQQVDETVTQRLQNEYGTDLVNFNIDYYRLLLKNEKLILLVQIDIDLLSGDDTYGTSQNYYYEII